VTVLCQQDYTEISVRMTEAVAAGATVHSKVLFPLFKEPGADYIVDTCTEVQDHAITTKCGQTIEYDVLVLATGLSYPIFQAGEEHPTAESRQGFISELNQKIAAANTIVIAGGGAVGCEAAADIKLRHGDKR